MRRLAWSLSLFLVGPLAAQEAVDRSYDLRPLTASLPGFVGQFDEPHLLLPVGPILGQEYNHEFVSDGGILGAEPIAAPWLVALDLVGRLEQLWLPENGSGEHLYGILNLRAPAAVHTRVHDLLSLFKAIRRQSSRVTLYELPKNAGTGSATVLSKSEVADLLRAAPPVQATVATVGLDTPWLWESGRSVRYVRDYDVEVAEKASIADPKLDVFFVGTRLGLGLTPMIDGRSLVRIGLQVTEQAEPMKPRKLPGDGLGAVHLPTVEALEITASAAVPAGGGLLLSGDRGRRSWLLRVEPNASPPLQFGAARALPLGSLAVPPLSETSSRELDLVARPGDDSRRRSSKRRAPDPLAMLGGLVGKRLDDSPAHAQTFGSHVVLMGSAVLPAVLEEKLQQQAGSLQTTSLVFRVGTVANAQALGHLAGRVSADELAAALPTEACAATLPGHHFSLALGRELSYVADYEVEIASKATAANPVVMSTFDGFRISGVLHRAGGRRPHLELRLQCGEVPAFEPMDLANRALGTVDPLVSAWTDVEQGVVISDDAWQVAHVQPDPAAPAERSLVLMLRAR